MAGQRVGQCSLAPESYCKLPGSPSVSGTVGSLPVSASRIGPVSFAAQARAVMLGPSGWRPHAIPKAQSQGSRPPERVVMLQFDAETTRLLENAYRGSDVVKRRLATLEALAPGAGETIVDVGSGPGYLTVELARAVGNSGKVIGVDPSADMQRAAASQCNGFSNVRILDGTAAELPLDDAS